jgi:hypothetical protein
LDENTKGERILLTEMSKVPANITGLPMDIWVDENNTYLKGCHGPRIKFPATKGEKNSHNYASMSISDNPTPFNLPTNKSIITNKELELIADFIRSYKNELIKLSSNKMTYEQFINELLKNKEKNK